MQRDYIRGLDGLRGVAAFMVFVVHVWSAVGYPDVPLRIASAFEVNLADFFGFGVKGVLLFFCLSGFLLSLPFWRALENPKYPVNLPDYFRKRFFRVYPAYCVAVIAYLLFQGGQYPLLIQSTFLISHMALIHNFYEAYVFQISVPLWSVATEFQMYLLLPVIFFITWKLKKFIHKAILLPFLIYLTAGLLGIAFLSAVTHLVTNFSIPSSILQPNGGVIFASPLVRLTHFCWGILCAYFYLRIIRKIRKPHALFEIATGVTFLAIMIVALFGLESGLELPHSGWPGAPVLFGLLILFVSLSQAKYGAAACLEWKPVRFFGAISYSFYLYHDLVLVRVFHGLPDFFPGSLPANTLSKGAFAFAITILISWLSYALVERRLTAWLKQNLIRKTGMARRSQIWSLDGETRKPVTEVKSE